MAHPGTTAASPPTMREVRDHVLSVLLSSGNRQDAAAGVQPSPGVLPPVPTQQGYQYPPIPPANTATPGSAPTPYPHAHPPAPPQNFAGSTPAPVGATPSWAAPPPNTATVPWTSPLRPVEADVRVAELTAGLVAATDIERRQADTIRRLAAQLEKAERLERQRSNKKHPAATTSRALGGRGQKNVPSVRLVAGRDELDSPLPGSLIGDDTASDLTDETVGEDHRRDARSRDAAVPRTSSKMRPTSRRVRVSLDGEERRRPTGPRTSSSRKPGTRSREPQLVGKSRAKGADAGTPRPAGGAAGDVESFEDLRRKVLAMELRNRGTNLERENAALLAEREEARREAGNLSSALGEIRQTATSLIADREQLLVTINQLRTQAQLSASAVRNGSAGNGARNNYAGSASNEVGQPHFTPHQRPKQSLASAGNRRRREQVDADSVGRESDGGNDLSPSSVCFPGFDTPTPCCAGPFDRGVPERAPALEGHGEEGGGKESEEVEARMEQELRTELRAVLDENAALSHRIIELESGAKEGDSLHGPGMEALQTEVMVLASVADCMDFNIARMEDAARTQATMVSAADGDATAALLGGRRCGRGSGQQAIGTSNSFQGAVSASAGVGTVQEIAEQLARTRHAIALKYGQWLSSQPGGDLLTTIGLDVTGGIDGIELPGAEGYVSDGSFGDERSTR